MASKIDFSELNLNEEEARSTSELVFEEVYSKPEILEAHDIQTGVEMDKRIPIMGQFDLVGQVDPGDCSTNEGGTIPTSEKTWTPKLISFRLTHCQAELPTLLKFWKKSRIAKNTWEEVDNEMLAFVTDRALDATAESILRIADFGDVDATAVGDGGAENLTAGVDKTYFNMLNGMWKQVFTDQAGDAEIYRYTISENGEASKAAQDALATDRALKAMRSMYNNIDARAHNGNLVFQMTRSMFNNWQDYLEDKSLSFMLERTEEGKVTQWSYRGIPIVVRSDWDRYIRTYKNLGATFELPHRIVLTDLMNIPIGTSDEESMKDFTSHYSLDDKKHYIDVAYKLDMKILLEYAMAVAY